jgi:hypothetical protein
MGVNPGICDTYEQLLKNPRYREYYRYNHPITSGKAGGTYGGTLLHSGREYAIEYFTLVDPTAVPKNPTLAEYYNARSAVSAATKTGASVDIG